MAVRGQEGVGVADRQGAGRPVDGHPLAVPRWAGPGTVGPCPAIAVPMAVVPPTPKLGVMAAVIAINAVQGMVAGSGRGMAIDPENASEIDLAIDSEIAPQTDLAIDPENASEIDLAIDSEIAPESASEIAPVPSTESRTPLVRSLRTTAPAPDVFGTEMIVMAIGVAPGMNGVSRPSAPDRVTTIAVPSDRMQHRRPQRPHPQRMI